MKTAPDLRLVHGGLIVGRLIDDETGKPFRPATLDPSWDRPDIVMYGPSRPRSGGACEGASIQEDGSFQLRAAPGDNELCICDPKHLALYRVSIPSRSKVALRSTPLAFHLDVARGKPLRMSSRCGRRRRRKQNLLTGRKRLNQRRDRQMAHQTLPRRLI